MLIPHKGHTDTIQVYSVTVMTHVKALQAGHSSQGTSEPITPVTPSDVLKTAVKLKNKTSHGHDGISTKLLKESISIIINPITHIINRSFDTGIVPHEMKKVGKSCPNI